MSDTLDQAFHFDSLVWHGPIALYLFLLGLSAGAAMLAVVLKRWIITGPVSGNGLIRAAAVIAPVGIILSLVILVQDLTMPLAFWKLMIYYNFSSVMAIGVFLLQVYTAVVVLWLMILFRRELDGLVETWMPAPLARVRGVYHNLMLRAARFEGFIELLLILIALSLGAYTGFLLAELKTYPMLNNPILPVLFLFSGLSSGAAGVMLMGVTVFKASLDDASVRWLHKLERPVMVTEVLVLVAFFGWLFHQGSRSEIAAITAIGSGFWAGVFWLGIVGLGLVTPLGLQTLTPPRAQNRLGFVVLVTSCSLLGVLMLRYFMLYAGQMTVY